MANLISQKCLYGLKAIFHLAGNRTDRPIKIASIAKRQNIPIRFLEAILRQLRQGGFVESRRGAGGGYFLAKDASEIKVSDIISFFEGGWARLPSAKGPRDLDAADEATLVLSQVWKEGQEALHQVFDSWTFADLLEKAETNKSKYIVNFNI